MDNLINWEKLKSYQDDKKKSFEELCYQIVFELYSAEGKLTSIDDSGGGDGVEFYLELPDGDIWGWQCKFFGRFSESGRKGQIKKSLQRAADIHGSKLKKWFLCSKLSMTSGEKSWLEGVGTEILNARPVLSSVCSPELTHWGDSEVLNFLRKYPDIQKYFFSDKILDLEWFKHKFTLVSESKVIKSKYLEQLHIEGSADEDIAKAVGGKVLAALIDERSNALNIDKFKSDYAQSMKNIQENGKWHGFEKTGKVISEFALTDTHLTLIERGNSLLRAITQILPKQDLYGLSEALIDINTFVEEYRNYYNEYSKFKEDTAVEDISWRAEKEQTDESIKRKISKYRDCLLGPYFIMRNYDVYMHIFQLLESLNETEIHITGSASKGKTHLVVNTVRRQIETDKPAIFLFGSHFRSNLPVKEQIKTLLDIPTNWTVKDLFGALDVCARIYKTKLVIAIDGLNESAFWKDIWSSGIEEIANEIRLYFPNILFMTTYRTSYEEVLFPKYYLSHPEGKWNTKVEVEGFTHYNVSTAIKRYCAYYGITLENNSDRFSHFREPLYLKIFCEAKKGQTVSFHNEDMFDIFEQYLEKCNENIVERLGKDLRYSKSFTKDILNKVSTRLWNSDKRDVAVEEVVPEILDHEMLRAFEGEDLLIFRDWDEIEVVAFTYDLLNGYLIAKSILNDIGDAAGVQLVLESKKFIGSLLAEGPRHSLYDDILRSFSILAIKRFGLECLISESHTLTKYSLEALFDLNAEVVSKNETQAKKIVTVAFKDVSRTRSVISLFENTEMIIEHPLNFFFLSELLQSMHLSFRDIYWTEYCRRNYSVNDNGGLWGFINNFQKINQETRTLSDRVHIAAKKAMWLLTSTDRDMRDRATKALYYYGRKYPAAFLEITSYSLKINDPYIWERTLGALYGVVLAQHNSIDGQFKVQYLKDIGMMLYKLIFAADAPYSTTHILARSYAAMSIETTLKYYPDLLTEEEANNIRGPYEIGGIRDWGEYDYTKMDEKLDDPIHMDFSNYTLGQIVKDGGSYSDPETKQQARRQIYWRIFQLGWDSLKFKDIDSRIQTLSYSSRNEKAKIERYGKKYSWIAFYELAGYRDDNGLLENKWKDYRVIQPDIDLSFPSFSKRNTLKFTEDDFLGDREMPLIDWYTNGGGVDISHYLEIKDLNEQPGNWICLDGFISQKDKKINRERFIFIRTLLISNKDLNDALERLKKQDLRGRWLPEKHQNHYCFAGEMYLFDKAVHKNVTNLSFIESTNTIKVKRGEPGYYPTFNFDTFEMEFPEEMEVTKQIKKKFKVLLPVMEYAFSSESSLNETGYHTVVSKEFVKELDLINQPQTFGLRDKNGILATQEPEYYIENKNSKNFIYIRKDLLDKFLKDKGYSLVWGIWGERQITFENLQLTRDLHSKSGLKNFPVFSSIEVYKDALEK